VRDFVELLEAGATEPFVLDVERFFGEVTRDQ